MAELDDIKKLRALTGVGIMSAKEALREAKGDLDEAIRLLRQRGLAKAGKLSAREARAGLVESYIHNGKIGALVEVNCETDFVARTDDFKQFARDVAMQITASHPLYVRPEEIPEEIIEQEKDIYRAGLKDKSADAVDKIIAGKLEKFYAEVCLISQPFVKHPELTVGELQAELVAKLGENVVIRRMARFELGHD